MQDAVRDLINKRRGRALRIILQTKDDLIAGRVPPDDADELRAVIVDEINDLVHVLSGLLEAMSGEQVLLNEHWLAMVEQIHTAVVPASRPEPPPVHVEAGPRMMSELR